MGIIARIKAHRQARRLARARDEPGRNVDIRGVYRTRADYTMTNSEAIYAAVSRISNTIASLPIHLYRDREIMVDHDLERLIGRVAFGTAGPRDLIALKISLQMLPALKQTLGLFSAGLLKELNGDIDPLEDIASLLEASIEDDPPLSPKEGGVIKAGYSEEIDRLKSASTEGKNWLLALEQEERERTGIKTLRVKFNRVFGYCIEVTNSFRDMVPDDYIRKQTLVGAER